MQVAKNTLGQDKQVEYASFNRRVIAISIDLLASAFLIIPLSFYLEYFLFGNRTVMVIMQEFLTKLADNQVDPLAVINELSRESFFLKYLAEQLIIYLFLGVIIVTFWWKAGTTPGKWLTECKILNEEDLQEPTRAQYVKRYLAYLPSNIFFSLGFLLLGYDKKKRAWHDKMVGTVVIIKKHDWQKITKGLTALWNAIKTTTVNLLTKIKKN